MELFRYETGAGEVVIREIVHEDIPAIIELNKAAFPAMAEENVVWSAAQLQNHQRVFPDGQICAVLNGEIVGSCSSLIVRMGDDPFRPHTYAGITDGGYFHNHDAQGDTLYGADVCVHPDYQGKRIGAALYEARRQLCKRWNLRRILAGGRISGYVEHADSMTPEDYVSRVVQGEFRDPVLSFQLHEGFVLRGVLRNYIVDPLSRNHCSIIEWLNPDYSEREANTKVRIACVQYQMRRVKDFEEFASQVEYFVETASDYRSDFVVFPEFFSVQLLSSLPQMGSVEGISRLADMADEFTGLMTTMAKRYGLYVIAGSHPFKQDDGKLLNTCLVIAPDGKYVGQPKLHITPSEKRYWGISGGSELYVIPTPKAKIGVQICYDIEFPEASRYLADQGCEIIFVPFCTDDRHGYLRVRHCAQARAIENQVFVATTGVIGNLPSVPAMDIHYGQASVLTPSDFEFARDGIQAQSDTNVETMLVTDVDVADLHRSRAAGSVTPRLDRRHDLFELKVKLKNLDTDLDLQDAPPSRLPK